MWSLVNTRFGQELCEIVTQRDLDKVLTLALLQREGKIGQLR
jgi:hypothetical protein